MNNIFIVGCGHTGTTLLLAMLLQHSKCFGIRYESRIFFNKSETEAVNFINSFKNEQYDYFVEKTPTNVYKIDTILSNWPNSKIIVCVRNPLDTIASLMRRGFSYELSLDRYLRENNAWLPYKNDVIVFNYDIFIENPASYLKKICSSLNISFELSMLDYFKNDNIYFQNYISKKDFICFSRKANTINCLNKLERGEGNDHRLFRNFQLKQPLFDGRNNFRDVLSEDEIKTVEHVTEHISRISQSIK